MLRKILLKQLFFSFFIKLYVRRTWNVLLEIKLSKSVLYLVYFVFTFIYVSDTIYLDI